MFMTKASVCGQGVITHIHIMHIQHLLFILPLLHLFGDHMGMLGLKLILLGSAGCGSMLKHLEFIFKLGNMMMKTMAAFTNIHDILAQVYGPTSSTI